MFGKQKQFFLSEKDHLRLGRVIKWAESVMRGGMAPRRQRVGGSEGGITKMKTQSIMGDSASIPCKMLDSQNVAIGENIIVNVKMNKNVLGDVTDYWPNIGVNEYVWAAQDSAGDWILVRPDVQLATVC